MGQRQPVHPRTGYTPTGQERGRQPLFSHKNKNTMTSKSESASSHALRKVGMLSVIMFSFMDKGTSYRVRNNIGKSACNHVTKMLQNRKLIYFVKLLFSLQIQTPQTGEVDQLHDILDSKSCPPKFTYTNSHASPVKQC